VVWLGIIGVSGFAGVMIGGCSGFGMGVYWVIARAKVAGHLQECKMLYGRLCHFAEGTLQTLRVSQEIDYDLTCCGSGEVCWWVFGAVFDGVHCGY